MRLSRNVKYFFRLQSSTRYIYNRNMVLVSAASEDQAPGATVRFFLNCFFFNIFFCTYIEIRPKIPEKTFFFGYNHLHVLYTIEKWFWSLRLRKTKHQVPPWPFTSFYFFIYIFLQHFHEKNRFFKKMAYVFFFFLGFRWSDFDKNRVQRRNARGDKRVKI